MMWSGTRLGTLVLVGAAGALIGAGGSREIRAAEPALPPHAAVAAPGPSIAGPAVALDTFQRVAARDDAAVVNISTSKVVHQARMEGDPFAQLFGGALPFGRGGDSESLTQRALGSGFIVDGDGSVLTNRHVIDGADQVTVTLANGHHYRAKVVGQDARTDIALLKIEPHETLTALPLGNSDSAQVGEWVMAVGNPFGLGGNSVTVGVVSFKGRALDLQAHGTPVEMLQTDAAINPGNSGGPLINARGEAIGINTLIISGGAQQYSGVGFAVPINVAREELPQLRSKGYVSRGFLGVSVQALDEDLARSLEMSDNKGALVSNVTSGSPAEKAGLQPGDVVRTVDGKPVEDSAEFSHQVASQAPGSTLTLGILRDGAQKQLEAKLGTFPDERDREAASAGQEKGRLGMAIEGVTPDVAQSLDLPASTHGVVVMRVEPGSRAENAGLLPRDVIVSVDGQSVNDPSGFRAAIDKARPAGVARLRVHRGDGYEFLAVKLA